MTYIIGLLFVVGLILMGFDIPDQVFIWQNWLGLALFGLSMWGAKSLKYGGE